MAHPKKALRKGRRRFKSAKGKKADVPTILARRPAFPPEQTDIALNNLHCAAGLPGAEKLDVPRLLRKLDQWAELVRVDTDRNYHKFLKTPWQFNNSTAYFCVVCMVAVLERRCGVRYNPKWTGITIDEPIPREFGSDARDLFIHAIIDGPGGTCGSLPVLHAAVGRRLGYPLKIVKAFQHLFLRWDDPKGKYWLHPARFNIEATGPGIHRLPDEHYKTWPRRIPPEDIEAGTFLKSLTSEEELAEFINARANCIAMHGKLADAVKTMRKAVELAPHNRRFRRTYENWEAHRKFLVRGHSFLSNPPQMLPREEDQSIAAIQQGHRQGQLPYEQLQLHPPGGTSPPFGLHQPR